MIRSIHLLFKPSHLAPVCPDWLALTHLSRVSLFIKHLDLLHNQEKNFLHYYAAFIDTVVWSDRVCVSNGAERRGEKSVASSWTHPTAS